LVLNGVLKGDRRTGKRKIIFLAPRDPVREVVLMQIVDTTISIGELHRMAAEMFGDLVKAVVDVDRELIAVDAELHSDLEALLLNDGSNQGSLWGINLYP